MQSFGDLLASNKLLVVGVLLAALAIILAVGVALFRLVFGRRLHMAGGRTRQPRLGVVDAFDLDRQRQLVLVRRDNVEHLVMIGGPNDVVIESAIVRAPAALNSRDKDNGAIVPAIGAIPAPSQVAAPVVPVTVVPPAGHAPVADPEFASVPPAIRAPEAASPIPEPKGEPEPAQKAAATPAPASPDPRLPPATMLPNAQRGFPAPVAPRQPSTLPPRPPLGPSSRPGGATPTRSPFARATPLPAGSSNAVRSEPPPPRAQGPESVETPDGEVAKAPTPAAEVAQPPGPPVQGPAEGTVAVSSAAPAGSGLPNTPRPGTPLPPRPPAARPAAVPPGRANLPTLGSLEEEMAKLLGRPLPPPDQPGS